MSYGGSRDYRLFFRSKLYNGQGWIMLGPGYCYKTEAHAEKGLERIKQHFDLAWEWEIRKV